MNINGDSKIRLHLVSDRASSSQALCVNSIALVTLRAGTLQGLL